MSHFIYYYAECHYAECRYAERQSAIFIPSRDPVAMVSVVETRSVEILSLGIQSLGQNE